MDQATRGLMLKVCNGDMRVPQQLYWIRENPRRVEFLSYLVQRGIVGEAFLVWLRDHYAGSILEAVKDVLGARGPLLYVRRRSYFE